jgi:hypothetical protein
MMMDHGLTDPSIVHFLPPQVDDLDPARLFVGLPIDSVTDGATVNSAAAIAAGIRAVRLLGADGVELPVFWSVAQPESPDRFSWAGYQAVADMVRAEGLSLRVSLRTHGTPGAGVPTLPSWVSGVAADDPDIFFTNRSGGRHEGCLSFAIDDLPVLHGKSPLQLYEAFFRSFAVAFDDFFDSTITVTYVAFIPVRGRVSCIYACVGVAIHGRALLLVALPCRT